MGECTYCAIRFAAGPLRSKPLDKILEEFDAGLQNGYQEFKLIAGDLGAYGQDLGTNVAILLERLLRRKTDYRLTLLDMAPHWFVQYSAELTRLFAANQEKIRLLMLPIQSGNSAVLKRMCRPDIVSSLAPKLKALRSQIPTLALATHVLVGFPGESEQEFEDTLKLLRTVKFDRVDVYRYSDRPNTEATQLPGKVSEEIKKQRTLRILGEFAGTALTI